MADGKATVHHHLSLPFKVIRPEQEPGHVYLILCVSASKGRVAKSHFHVNQKKKETKRLENNMYKYVMRGVCALGPPTKVVCHHPKKV